MHLYKLCVRNVKNSVFCDLGQWPIGPLAHLDRLLTHLCTSHSFDSYVACHVIHGQSPRRTYPSASSKLQLQHSLLSACKVTKYLPFNIPPTGTTWWTEGHVQCSLSSWRLVQPHLKPTAHCTIRPRHFRDLLSETLYLFNCSSKLCVAGVSPRLITKKKCSKKPFVHNDTLRNDIAERIATISRPNGPVCGRPY